MSLMSRRLLGGAAGLLAVAVLGSTQAAATTVTYAVNRKVGVGRITGTIVTNGTIGSLSAADILDWNLKIDADGNPSTSGQLVGPLSGGNSAVSVGGWQLSATATGLFFDFGAGMMNVFQFFTPDYSVVWQLQAGMPFKDELIRESQYPLVQAYAYRGDVTEPLASADQVDTTLPTISDPTADPFVLWPPNHQMIDVTISYDAADDSGSVECALGPVICSETSDPRAWVVLDEHHVQLVSECAGKGIGRLYAIPITCTDPSGNKSTKRVLVTVPHDQR